MQPAPPDLVDWRLASRVGGRFAPSGPDTTPEEARQVVADLRRFAREAVPLVSEASGLSAPEADNTAVVDRQQWIDSNIAGIAQVVKPLAESLAERSSSNAAVRGAGAAASGAQLGAAMGWMSGKVLGQYEVFVPAGTQPRLLLVAPNIRAAESAMGVDPQDFRLWVCLHEEAHRVQFGATSWLADFFSAEVDTYLTAADVGTAEALRRLAELVKTLARILAGDPEASMVSAVQNEAQQEIFERLSALMALLEGHAEWVMDAVGTSAIPSLPRLRAAFERRRAHPDGADGLVRRLMGMDAKLRQYSSGRAFVSEVVDSVGVDGFNRVWRSPEMLPSIAEIADPGSWVERVHGPGQRALDS